MADAPRCEPGAATETPSAWLSLPPVRQFGHCLADAPSTGEQTEHATQDRRPASHPGKREDAPMRTSWALGTQGVDSTSAGVSWSRMNRGR
jgi:hypothetical protein